jgi:Protein of unknown function (DUF3185)
MKLFQILGLAVLAVGVILLVFAYHASNAPIDQLSDALTGRFTDRTMWYFIVGGAALVGGTAMMLFGKRISVRG